MRSVEIMEKLGFKLGDCVVGTCPEDGEVTVLKLLRIDGLGRLVAKKILKNGEEWDGFECNWTLSMREWKKYEQADSSAGKESHEEKAHQSREESDGNERLRMAGTHAI